MTQISNQANIITKSANHQYIGLSTQIAAQRLKTDGYNELPSTKKRSFLRIVFEIIKEPMFILLMGAGVVYLLLVCLALLPLCKSRAAKRY